MPSEKKISGEDRRFLRLVADATFTNPFSDERAKIDRQILGRDVSDRLERVRLLHRAVSDRIAVLDKNGGANLRNHSGEDHEVLRAVFLFEVYYGFMERFDRHILDQIDAGEEPAVVPFAGNVLKVLQSRGFEPEDATQLFAVMYQVRRAHYFIDHALTGISPCMKELRRNLWNSVFTHDVRWYERYLIDRMEDFSTLILGETGAGKGSAAAAIWRSGFIPFDEKKNKFVESFTRAFVSINLSQYQEMLIESELFGHKKGAFTRAIEDHEGVFARCSEYGAIFLDEIGEVSVPIQIKLLQVLQERVFFPVGDRATKRFRGRVIAATNSSPDELRREGRFRDDFYYRLCSQIITVPSLRPRLDECPEELDGLLEHTLSRLTGAHDAKLFEMGQ